MPTSLTLGLVATWFVLGQARLVLASRLAEHRLEAPELRTGRIYNLAAAVRGGPEAYDGSGRQLLPWYRAVSASYWALVAAIGVGAILGGRIPWGGG